jgi:hypothetical protein
MSTESRRPRRPLAGAPFRQRAEPVRHGIRPTVEALPVLTFGRAVRDGAG